MAGPHACYSFWNNFSLINKDKLAKNDLEVPTKSNNISTFVLAIF